MTKIILGKVEEVDLVWFDVPGPLLSSFWSCWQLLQSFEDIQLCDILGQIQEKYNLQAMNKVRVAPRQTACPRTGMGGTLFTCVWIFF